jgi:valyl-tRNA synthetase
MSLSKRYRPGSSEPALMRQWQENGTYHFQPDSDEPIYTIDTPPPTVSGKLHMGHITRIVTLIFSPDSGV